MRETSVGGLHCALPCTHTHRQHNLAFCSCKCSSLKKKRWKSRTMGRKQERKLRLHFLTNSCMMANWLPGETDHRQCSLCTGLMLLPDGVCVCVSWWITDCLFLFICMFSSFFTVTYSTSMNSSQTALCVILDVGVCSAWMPAHSPWAWGILDTI